MGALSFLFAGEGIGEGPDATRIKVFIPQGFPRNDTEYIRCAIGIGGPAGAGAGAVDRATQHRATCSRRHWRPT